MQKAVTVKLESKRDEKTGRMNMVPVKGTEEVIEAQLVLIAAGFLGSQKYVTEAFRVSVNERSNVATKPGEYETSIPGIFTAGICTGGSPWSSGLSGKDGRQRRQWMPR